MFTFLTVPRNQRVALILDGRFDRLFGPGKHTVWTGFSLVEWIRIDLAKTIVEAVMPMDPLPTELPGALVVEVGPAQRLVVLLNGALAGTFGAGAWRVWTEVGRVQVLVAEPEAEPLPITAEDPLNGIRAGPFTEVEAGEKLVLVLMRDGQPFKALVEGKLRIWTGSRWSARLVDMRLQTLDLAAQDLLTADQVAVRVKPTVTWKVEDPLAFLRQPEAQAMLWTAVQLALRERIAARTLEELLADKRALTEEIGERARELLPGVGVALISAAVKDVVLPGEVKDLLNKVTLARKEAEALAIKRREEVAHTRQLLNTAKILESNPVLMRLKELEALGELAGKVGELKVVLGEDAQKLVLLRQ